MSLLLVGPGQGGDTLTVVSSLEDANLNGASAPRTWFILN